MKFTAQDDESMVTGSGQGFSFSGVRPEKLGATEYTLCTLVSDVTGSMSGHEGPLLAMAKEVVAACKKNPRAEFLMLRRTEFNTQVFERNGFVEVNNIDTSQWAPPHVSGMTNLFDAVYEAVAATNDYSKILTDQDFSVNGVVFVITDGEDTTSLQTPKSIRDEINRGIKNEVIESLNVILIGINAKACRVALETFQKGAGLTQYVDAGSTSSAELAKLANFIAASISSQSQSLGTGGPSQALTF